MTERDNSKHRESVRERLASTRSALLSTEHALDDYRNEKHDWRRRRTVFHNYVVNARRVTFMLQRLDNVHGFREWYASVQDGLIRDPLAESFSDLRTTIEKQVSVDLYWQWAITTGPSQTAARLELIPDGADMRVAMYDPEDPSDTPMPLTVPVYQTVADERLPEEFRQTPLDQLMERHLRTLQSIVSDATFRFGQTAGTQSRPVG